MFKLLSHAHIIKDVAHLFTSAAVFTLREWRKFKKNLASLLHLSKPSVALLGLGTTGLVNIPASNCATNATGSPGV